MKNQSFILFILFILFFSISQNVYAKEIIVQALQNQDYGDVVTTPRLNNFIICDSDSCDNNRAKFILPPQPAIIQENTQNQLEQQQNMQKNTQGIVPERLTIYFPTNIYRLNKFDINQLDTFFTLYKNQINNYNLAVFGYTDKYGTKSYNDWLARKRAIMVANYIKSHYGVVPFEVKGFGKQFYVSKKAFLNRRVDVKFIQK
ncbi:MAG: OmpA family protein [Thermoplasmata archaeon]